MYTPNLVSILLYHQPLSIFKFDDVMPTSRIEHLLRLGIKFVLVFDGTPPEIKSGQEEQRAAAKVNAKQKAVL